MATMAGVPPSSATHPPALADEEAGIPERVAGGARLWVKEAGQPTMWHIVTERIAYQWYRMACGWEARMADAELVWPAKDGEPQPPPRSRCRSCVQMHEVTMLLGGPVLGPDTRRVAGRS